MGGSVLLRNEAAPSLPVFRANGTNSLRLVDVRPGLYETVVRCPGHATLKDEVLVETRDRREIEIAPGLTITGTVRDALGKPAADARVYVRGDESEASSSDSSGGFEISGVHSGPVTIIANGANSLRAAPGTLNVDLSGDRDGIELSLPATGELHGRLFSDDDSPAVGAHVVLYDREGTVVHRLVSDDRGEFTVSPPPGSYTVRASWGELREFDDQGQSIEILGSGPTEVTFSLPTRPDYRASGRIVDQDGGPLADVAVRANSGAEVLTDADGRFSIGSLQNP